MLKHGAKLHFLQWDTACNVIGLSIDNKCPDDNDDDNGDDGNGGGSCVDDGDYQGTACPTVEPVLLLKKEKIFIVIGFI